MPGSNLSAELLLRLSPYLHSKPLFKGSQEFLLFAPFLFVGPTADFLSVVTITIMSFSPSFWPILPVCLLECRRIWSINTHSTASISTPAMSSPHWLRNYFYCIPNTPLLWSFHPNYIWWPPLKCLVVCSFASSVLDMLSLYFVHLGREWWWQVFVLGSTNSLFSLNTVWWQETKTGTQEAWVQIPLLWQTLYISRNPYLSLCFSVLIYKMWLPFSRVSCESWDKTRNPKEIVMVEALPPMKE